MSGLPSNIYSGGAVTFNSQPYAAFYLNSIARKRAKQEAVDNYYTDLGKNLTPAGMAANDIEPFMGKVNGWRDFITQNRGVLDNPNHPDYARVTQQANYLYNDAVQSSETSKSKVKDLVNAKNFIKPDRDLTHASLQSMHDAGLPIENGYKPLDFSTFQYEDKPFDVLAQRKAVDQLKQIKLSSNITNTTVDKKTGNRITTTHHGFDPQALQTIAHIGESDYQSNHSIQSFTDKQLNTDEAYNTLNPVYKNAFGKDIEHPEELYTAWLLAHKQSEYSQQNRSAFTPYTNPYDIAAYRNSLTAGRERGFYDYKQEHPDMTDENVINQMVQDKFDEAKTSDVSRSNMGISGGRVTLNLSDDEKKMFGQSTEQQLDNGTTKIVKSPPNMVAVSKDGKYLIPISIYQETDKDGNTTTTTEDGAPVSVSEWKDMLRSKYLPKSKFAPSYKAEGGGKPQQTQSNSSSSSKKTRPPLDSYIKSK